MVKIGPPASRSAFPSPGSGRDAGIRPRHRLWRRPADRRARPPRRRGDGGGHERKAPGRRACARPPGRRRRHLRPRGHGRAAAVRRRGLRGRHEPARADHRPRSRDDAAGGGTGAAPGGAIVTAVWARVEENPWFGRAPGGGCRGARARAGARSRAPSGGSATRMSWPTSTGGPASPTCAAASFETTFAPPMPTAHWRDLVAPDRALHTSRRSAHRRGARSGSATCPRPPARAVPRGSRPAAAAGHGDRQRPALTPFRGSCGAPCGRDGRGNGSSRSLRVRLRRGHTTTSIAASSLTTRCRSAVKSSFICTCSTAPP